ncbi:hypothetical protein GCK72_024732 [Caenorhabditis remanei]|uniref:Uncharacterized protein n=1 Tax=Caenorhabditis remanei TaxID=31234 RepID=A0A6A5G0T3_CAERE|nr:hypothetical protein GCK72_024732 [Caenorhabditis remanei]KAF1748265.1 hypothetical protein GCK72_024732 [Caenorhabditis remanei]
MTACTFFLIRSATYIFNAWCSGLSSSEFRDGSGDIAQFEFNIDSSVLWFTLLDDSSSSNHWWWIPMAHCHMDWKMRF